MVPVLPESAPAGQPKPRGPRSAHEKRSGFRRDRVKGEGAEMAETDGSRAPAHSDLIVSDGSERASRAGNRNTTWAAHELALAYTNAQPVGPDRGKVERLEKEEGVLLNPRALGVDPLCAPLGRRDLTPSRRGRRPQSAAAAGQRRVLRQAVRTGLHDHGAHSLEKSL